MYVCHSKLNSNIIINEYTIPSVLEFLISHECYNGHVTYAGKKRIFVDVRCHERHGHQGIVTHNRVLLNLELPTIWKDP
jgi:hypothetical protein